SRRSPPSAQRPADRGRAAFRGRRDRTANRREIPGRAANPPCPPAAFVTGGAASRRGRTRRVVISTLLVLAIGAVLLAPILYYASTVDVRPPQVNRFVLSQHLPGDDGVALTTSSLEVVFSEAVQHQGAQAAFTLNPQVSGSFSWSGVTMIFTPAERLPLQTSFSMRLRGKVSDLAGNVMNGAGPYTFHTVGGPSIV